MQIFPTAVAMGAIAPLDQAAAEYVGVALSGAMRSIGNGLRSAGQRIEDEPLYAIAAVVAVLILLRLMRRRRL